MGFVVCMLPQQTFHGNSNPLQNTLTMWFINSKSWEKPAKLFCLSACLIKTTEFHTVISAQSPAICGSNRVSQEPTVQLWCKDVQWGANHFPCCQNLALLQVACISSPLHNFCSLPKDINTFKHFCHLYQNSQTIKKQEHRDCKAQNTKQIHRKRRKTENLYVCFCCDKMDEIYIKMQGPLIFPLQITKWKNCFGTKQNKKLPNVHPCDL